MGDALKIYDSNEVDVIVAGYPIDSGRGTDEFVKIAFDSNAFEDVVGVDGQVARSKTNDLRATVTVTLMQTSKANAMLSALHQLDLNAPNGAGVGSLMIKDKQGTSLYAAAECWIQKTPDSSFKKTADERAWSIRCAKLIAFTGGN